MCQYMIQIAEETKERACFRCEHGTFHMIWGSGVFSLTLEELYSLKLLLIDARQGRLPSGQERLRLQRCITNDVAFFELWMEDVGIRLLNKDCQALEKLVSKALIWVQTQPPFTPTGHTKAAQWVGNMNSLPITLEALRWN